MKGTLAVGKPCRYWLTPGRWQRGTLTALDLLSRRATVQPSRTDLPPLEDLPLRQVAPLVLRARQRAAISGILAARSDRGGPAAVPKQPTMEGTTGDPPPSPRIVARLRTPGKPCPKPPRPIRSRAYLRWIRQLPCCGCGRQPAGEAHHYGPRGVGQTTDDPRTVPACKRCHRYYHRSGGCLPGRSKDETTVYVLRTELDLVIRYRWRDAA